MSFLDEQRRRLLVALGLTSSPLAVPDLWVRYLDALNLRRGQVLAERLRVYAPTLPGREWQALPTATVSFSAANPPDGNATVPYSYQFTATGGTAPYTFTLASGSVPSGTTLNSSGLLSGTPNTVALYAFVVRVTDAVGVSTTASVDVNIAA